MREGERRRTGPAHQQQQQGGVRVVAGARYVQRGPLVLILQVHVQPTANQQLRSKAVVMVSTLRVWGVGVEKSSEESQRLRHQQQKCNVAVTLW